MGYGDVEMVSPSDLKNPIVTVNTRYITLQEMKELIFLSIGSCILQKSLKVFTEFSLGIGFEHACGLYFGNQNF